MAKLSLLQFQAKAILFATILASGMAFLDGSVVTIAVPVMIKQLHAGLTDIQWIINGYTLMLSSLLLVAGSLGDRFGRKRVFLSGIFLFVIASFLCSISRTAFELTISRFIEGVGAAMMVPGSLSIIDVTFEESVRGSAIGIWSGFAGGIAALGPFIGGWLVQTLGWQSIFYINIPLGLIALWVTSRYVPESKNDESASTDWFGAASIFLSLSLLAYGFISAPVYGWNNTIILLSLIMGLVLFSIFIMIEKYTHEPLLPLHIFSSRLVAGANIATLFLYFALSGVIFFVVLNFQQLQHYSPLLSGLGLLPPIIIITFFSGPSGGLADRIGPRIPMIVGPALVGIGMSSFLLTGTKVNYFFGFLPGLILFGSGMAIVIAPLTKSALSVKKTLSGAASGVNNAVARVAGLLAVALLGGIFLSVFVGNLALGLQAIPLTSAQKANIFMQHDKLGAIILPRTLSSIQRSNVEKAVDNAFLHGFRWSIGISAGLAFLSSIVAYFLIGTE